VSDYVGNIMGESNYVANTMGVSDYVGNIMGGSKYVGKSTRESETGARAVSSRAVEYCTYPTLLISN